MRTPIIASIATALVILSGCASSAAPSSVASPAAGTTTASAVADSSEQSLSDACDEIGTTMDDASKTLDAAMKTIGSNPDKSLTALTSFTTTMETEVAKLGNPDVKAQGEKAVAALKGVTAALQDVVKHPSKASMTKLTGPLAKLDAEFTAIGTVCGG